MASVRLNKPRHIPYSAFLAALLWLLPPGAAMAQDQPPAVQVDNSVLKELEGYQPPPMFGAAQQRPVLSRPAARTAPRPVLTPPSESPYIPAERLPQGIYTPPPAPVPAAPSPAVKNQGLILEGDPALEPQPEKKREAVRAKKPATPKKITKKPAKAAPPPPVPAKKPALAIKLPEKSGFTETAVEAKPEKLPPVPGKRPVRTQPRPEPKPSAAPAAAPKPEKGQRYIIGEAGSGLAPGQKMPAVPAGHVDIERLGRLLNPHVRDESDDLLIVEISSNLRTYPGKLEPLVVPEYEGSMLLSEDSGREMDITELDVRNFPPNPVPMQTASLPVPERISIVFEAGAAEIGTEGQKALRAEFLSKIAGSKELRVEIHAFAVSADGDSEAAQRLSLSRALSVRAFLMDSGVDARRIDVRAMGGNTSESPADRVDLVIPVLSGAN